MHYFIAFKLFIYLQQSLQQQFITVIINLNCLQFASTYFNYFCNDVIDIYILKLCCTTISTTDDATEVLLNSDTPNQGMIEADTVVYFTCTSDANPDPLLSLWAVDLMGVQYMVLENNVPTSTMIESLALTANYNKHFFFYHSRQQHLPIQLQ